MGDGSITLHYHSWACLVLHDLFEKTEFVVRCYFSGSLQDVVTTPAKKSEHRCFLTHTELQTPLGYGSAILCKLCI